MLERATCPNCKTKYTEAQVEKLDSMTCIKCGAPLESIPASPGDGWTIIASPVDFDGWHIKTITTRDTSGTVGGNWGYSVSSQEYSGALSQNGVITLGYTPGEFPSIGNACIHPGSGMVSVFNGTNWISMPEAI